MKKQLPKLGSGGKLGFNQAFAQARKSGLKEFDWNGGKYSTITADEALEQNKPQWVYSDKDNYVGEKVRPTFTRVDGYSAIPEDYQEPIKPKINIQPNTSPTQRPIAQKPVNQSPIVGQPINQPIQNRQPLQQQPLINPASTQPNIEADFRSNPLEAMGQNTLLDRSGFNPNNKSIQQPIQQQPINQPLKKEVVYNNPKSEKNIVKKETNYTPPSMFYKDILAQERSFPTDVRNRLKENASNKSFETFNNKYFVYSKENGNLYAFNNKHELIDSTPAGRGAAIGDFENKSDLDSTKPGSKATTPAGRGVISNENKFAKDEYGSSTYGINYKGIWGNRQNLALHAIYPSEKAFRESIINNPKNYDKLVSWGCINVPEDKINTTMKPEKGDSIYIEKEPMRNIGPVYSKELPEYSLGSWLKENKEGVVGGVKTALGVGAMFIPGAQAIGAGLIGSGIQDIGSEVVDGNTQNQQNDLLATQQFNQDVANRMAGMRQNQGYMPVAKQGGFIVYKGETHEGPNGGILVDDKGNPTGLSNNKPIAITEKNEVSKYDPTTGSTYIYSDALGFAKPATNLVHKYKLDKNNSLYKNDILLKTAVDKQFENLTTAQELLKSKKEGKKQQLNMLKKGGELPILENGWDNADQDPNKSFLDPFRAWLGQPNSLTTPNYQRSYDPNYLQGSKIQSATYPEIRPTQYITPGQYTGQGGGMYPYRERIKSNKPIVPQQQTVFEIERGTPIKGPIEKPVVKTPISTEPWTRYAAPMQGTTDHLKAPSNFYKEPYEVDKDGRRLSGLAKGPTIPQQQEESFSPNLSPLGHIASAIGNLADYRALKNARPDEVNLPRVGAERISLARQRLINERNAADARNINSTNARNMGLNSGSAYSNISAANTGVNKLLGQENALSAMTEENTNAQLRQQANMVNAELAAQEGLFNTQSQNAYKMARARLNPLSNLARTAASYMADNASYKKGYDIAGMMSPNAEIFQDPDAGLVKKLLTNGAVKTRFK